MAEENIICNGQSMETGDRIKKLLNRIYDRMEQLDQTSEEYSVLNEQAIKLTAQQSNNDDSLRSRAQAAEMKGQRWMPLVQVIGQVVGSAAGVAVGQMLNRKTVNDVLTCEQNGHIVTTKATQFMQKPRS